MNRILVVTAVEAEAQAVRGADQTTVTVSASGVGCAAAAAHTAVLLHSARTEGRPYAAVLSAGIAGGFHGRVEVGGIAIGTKSIAADLGADSPTGFIGLAELGFGTGQYPADQDLLTRLRSALADAVAGPVLTVATVTGTAQGVAEILRRHPYAVAEAMEGFGVAEAAARHGTPFAEVRTISNVVGPRDRDAWRIPQALAALAEVGRAVGTLVG